MKLSVNIDNARTSNRGSTPRVREHIPEYSLFGFLAADSESQFGRMCRSEWWFRHIQRGWSVKLIEFSAVREDKMLETDDR